MGARSANIPTVYREDYLGGLRQLTRRQDPDTYIRMLQRAQLFSVTISGEDMDRMQNVLTEAMLLKKGKITSFKSLDLSGCHGKVMRRIKRLNVVLGANN